VGTNEATSEPGEVTAGADVDEKPETVAESSAAVSAGVAPDRDSAAEAAKPTAEPAAEPTAEVAAKPTAASATDPIAESAAEPAAEVAAEPTADEPGSTSGEPAARARHPRADLIRPAAIAAACVVVAAIVSIVAISSHHGSRPESQAGGVPSGQFPVPAAQGASHLSTSAAQPSSAASPQPAAAAPASVTADGISTAVVPLPPAHRREVRRWAAGPGGGALSSLTSQLSTVAQVGGVGQYATMTQDCLDLMAAVSRARAAAPIPDTRMQQAYSQSLTQVDGAAITCRSAIRSWSEGVEDIQTHVDQGLLRRSLAGLAAGAHQLYLATEQVRMLHS